MKILHLDQNHPLLIEQLTQAGFDCQEDYTSSKQDIENRIASYDGIVIRSRFKIDKQFLDAATHLKFIARVGAGLESIDVCYAASKNISLFAAPQGNKNAVGEHALGMLLSLFNKLNPADRQVKSGLWKREHNRGVEIQGKTIGLIGYGNMGRSFAKKLKGFNCTTLCYDIQKDLGNKNATQVSLQTLQEQADVVSLHTPWTPQTNKMVDAAFIAKFKKPFWLINTARGKSVVTKDVVYALKSGKILGAGLDVLEYEKLSFETFNKLNPADRQVKSGLWKREQNRGVEIQGKTIGLIGYGNMGRSFAKKLKGFNCTTLCYDIQKDLGNKNATQVSLQTLQEQADVLSLHTPWTPQTNQMVDAAFIAKFKKPFWLINTARGKSVVTKDVVYALKSGKILGAGLDVLEYEKLSFETLFTDKMPLELEELLAMDNVILSPHVAGWTIESKEKLAQVIVNKIVTTYKPDPKL